MICSRMLKEEQWFKGFKWAKEKVEDSKLDSWKVTAEWKQAENNDLHEVKDKLFWRGVELYCLGRIAQLKKDQKADKHYLFLTDVIRL